MRNIYGIPELYSLSARGILLRECIFITRNDRIIRTLECNETPTDKITTLRYIKTPTGIQIEWLETELEFQRQGYGSRAVRELQNDASALNLPIVVKCEERYIGLYKKLGFTQSDNGKLAWFPTVNK